MNIEKHLILIKGENKTEEVSECKYEDGKWHVNFENINTDTAQKAKTRNFK